MAEIGKYIYGIINSNAGIHLSIPKGLLSGEGGSNKAVYPVRNTAEATRDNKISNGVYTIPYQDISALVRDSEVIDNTHMRKDILARLLVGHQTIIERIMALVGTIIPMRLGTQVLDETEVKEILNKGYNLIKQIFEKTRDKIEIDVAATWSDFTYIVKEAGEEKEVKELKTKLLANPEGITTDDQMKIGFMLKKTLDEKRAKSAQEIQDRLKAVSEDFRIHELMDDHMVINSAFLIYKARYKDFEEKIEELNSEFNEKLNFRCVGPLPPYSFYTLEIKKIPSQDLDWARNRLNLKTVLDKEGLKKAYQRSASLYHPDKNPDKPGIEKEFDEVVKAYKILSEYCEALEQAGQMDKLHLDEKGYKRDALLVKVRD